MECARDPDKRGACGGAVCGAEGASVQVGDGERREEDGGMRRLGAYSGGGGAECEGGGDVAAIRDGADVQGRDVYGLHALQ